MNRIKHIEIPELKEYVKLLLVEREHISYGYQKNKAKIQAGDYEGQCPLASETYDEIMQSIQNYEEEGLTHIDSLLAQNKTKLRLLIQSRDKELSRHTSMAHNIRYRHKLGCDKDIRFISVGHEYLEKVIGNILYTVDNKKDMMKVSVLFEDGAVRNMSIHLDKLIETTQRIVVEMPTAVS